MRVSGQTPNSNAVADIFAVLCLNAEVEPCWDVAARVELVGPYPGFGESLSLKLCWATSGNRYRNKQSANAETGRESGLKRLDRLEP